MSSQHRVSKYYYYYNDDNDDDSGGGGGVPGSLEESGWATTQYYATVSGNNIDIAAGNTASRATLVPPAGSVHSSARFENGDVLKIAVKVKEVSGRVLMLLSDKTRAVFASKTGLFTADSGNGYATETGSDVLTLTFSGNVTYLRIEARSATGGTSSTMTADLDITGLSINGTVIYGKV